MKPRPPVTRIRCGVFPSSPFFECCVGLVSIAPSLILSTEPPDRVPSWPLAPEQAAATLADEARSQTGRENQHRGPQGPLSRKTHARRPDRLHRLLCAPSSQSRSPGRLPAAFVLRISLT